MRALLFLNGKPPKRDVLKSLDYGCFVACADGAYNYVSEFCTPNLVAGDFDSVKNKQLIKANKIITLPRHKDITDGHYVLNELLNAGAKTIEIFGALGGRIDHEYCNYSLLKIAADNGAEACIQGAQFSVYLAKESFYKNVKKGSIVSLAPFSDFVHILSSTGLAYKISDEVFCKTSSKGVSNIAVDNRIGFEIAGGCALCFVKRG